jgi:hypothetical protein
LRKLRAKIVRAVEPLAEMLERVPLRLLVHGEQQEYEQEWQEATGHGRGWRLQALMIQISHYRIR